MQKKKTWTLRELDSALRQAYSGKIGVEYMHVPNAEMCTFIRNNFELRQFNPIENAEKIHLFDRLLWTDEFAQFISTKFNTMKRFGLEGVESFIPGMKSCIDQLLEDGCRKVIIGMPHRGRLNMLANVVRKPLETIFAEFQGVMPSKEGDHDFGQKSGDVKYHLGTSYKRKYGNGKEMTVEILANPSHLECINPVVMGKVRSEQHYSGQGNNTKRNAIVPILIHGDAAFSG